MMQYVLGGIEDIPANGEDRDAGDIDTGDILVDDGGFEETARVWSL